MSEANNIFPISEDEHDALMQLGYGSGGGWSYCFDYFVYEDGKERQISGQLECEQLSHFVKLIREGINHERFRKNCDKYSTDLYEALNAAADFMWDNDGMENTEKYAMIELALAKTRGEK